MASSLGIYPTFSAKPMLMGGINHQKWGGNGLRSSLLVLRPAIEDCSAHLDYESSLKTFSVRWRNRTGCSRTKKLRAKQGHIKPQLRKKWGSEFRSLWRLFRPLSKTKNNREHYKCTALRADTVLQIPCTNGCTAMSFAPADMHTPR